MRITVNHYEIDCTSFYISHVDVRKFSVVLYLVNPEEASKFLKVLPRGIKKKNVHLNAERVFIDII